MYNVRERQIGVNFLSFRFFDEISNSSSLLFVINFSNLQVIVGFQEDAAGVYECSVKKPNGDRLFETVKLDVFGTFQTIFF